MFLSVAVSKAEVASSRSNSFGDLEIKNIYTRSYFRRYCSCTEKNAILTTDLFLCRSMFKNLQNSQSYVDTGYWALGTGHWADQPEESPGYRHPLLLSAAQFQTTLSHFCVVAVR